MDLCNLSLHVDDANEREKIVSVFEDGLGFDIAEDDDNDNDSTLNVNCNFTEVTENVLEVLKDFKWMAFAEVWRRTGLLESGIYLIASEKMSNKIDRQIYVSSMDFHNDDRYSFCFYPIESFESTYYNYGDHAHIEYECPLISWWTGDKSLSESSDGMIYTRDHWSDTEGMCECACCGGEFDIDECHEMDEDIYLCPECYRNEYE